MTLPKRTWLRNRLLTYNEIALRLDSLADRIRLGQYDALVIVLRGGTFAGVHIAFLTGLPIHFLQYDRSTEQASWYGRPPIGHRLLVCEDSAGKGFTLERCMSFLRAQGHSVDSLVVCQMPGSRVQPTFACFAWQDDTTRVLFPWNRFRLNSNSIGDDKPDHEYERTAWDLDGVFVDDMDPLLYHEDLDKVLQMRDQAKPASYAPMPKVGDAIITSRPACDFERTQHWLLSHGYTLPLFMRDDGGSFPSHEDKARWKGQSAVRLGFTHFVESHAEQAVHIASLFPELRVVWWNEGHPITVSAASVGQGSDG